ncbi:MAG TPA: hypothetical protein VHY32_04090 [Caulobacteraceae bacterium]|nr:hypothetical protein [Caulobacteraceae bacterium]
MSVTANTKTPRPDGRSADEPDLLDDPAWFLDRLDFERGAAVFTRTRREALSNAAFLDGRWNRLGASQRLVPFARLRSFRTDRPAPAIIWHTAFCCSTLVASLLDAPGTALALKEPMALVDLSAARRQGLEGEDPALASAAIMRIGLGFNAGERAVIKPSNGANGLIPDAAAIGAPMLLLYSSCRQFLLSVIGGGPGAGGGEVRRQFIRDLMNGRVRSQRPPLRFSLDHLSALNDLQVAALFWHVQIGELRAAARAFGPRQARSLDCERFLAEPARALAALDQLFALGHGEAHLRQAAQGPLMSRYAKQPNRAFDAADRDRGFKSIEADLGPTLDGLVAWSYRMCPETPRGDPVGAPLLSRYS